MKSMPHHEKTISPDGSHPKQNYQHLNTLQSPPESAWSLIREVLQYYVEI